MFTTAPPEHFAATIPEDSRRFDRLINLLIRAPESLASRARILWWRVLGAEIGARCRLARVEVPRNPWDIKLLDGVALDRGVVLLSTGTRTASRRIVLGPQCYVNRFTMIDASERIEIQRGSMVGPFCYITDHDHGMQRDEDVMLQPLVGAPVSIGEDVWLGAGVTVLKGVTIGDRAVVGAGSVVTRSIPAGAVAVGVPARVIGQRS